MGELAEQYGDRIHFNVLQAEETAKRAEEIEAFGFTAKKHGLVGFAPDGSVVAKVPGHSLSREAIVEVVDQLLRDAARR